MSGDALLLTASADAFDFLTPTQVATGTQIRVQDAAGLAAALKAATGGETILLAAGDYGRLVIDGRYAETVTLLADPAAPAVIRSLDIRGAAHVTLDGVLLDYTFTENKSTIQDRPFRITGSEAITLQNIHFDGDVAAGTGTADDGAGAGFGLVLKNSSGITVTRSLIEGFYRGAAVFGCTDITFTGNEITDIRSDGLNLTATQGATISGNHFHDFREASGSGDHKDMIQVYSANAARPSTDLTISGNIFDMGEGSTTQTVWLRNEAVDAGAGDDMFYRNIVIEDNFIRNGHIHGISVGQAHGVSVQNNTLVLGVAASTGGGGWPLVSVSAAATDVTIANNLGQKFDALKPQPGWTVTNNLNLQDIYPARPGYMPDIFVNPHAGTTAGPDDYRILPDSSAILDGQGPDWMRQDIQPQKILFAPEIRYGPEMLFTPDAMDDRLKVFLDADAGDAPVLIAPGAPGVQFGRLTDFEDSQQIAISTTFGRLNDGSGTGHLIWNQGRLVLSLSNDALMLQVATAEPGDKLARFRTGDLGLDKAGMHEVIVMVDAEADRLKLYLDDVLVLDERSTDLEMVETGREYGWDAGSRWNSPSAPSFAVSVTDFALADFSALDAATMAGLIA